MCCIIGEIGGIAQKRETWTSVERMGKPFEVHRMKICTSQEGQDEDQRHQHKDKTPLHRGLKQQEMSEKLVQV